MNLITVFQTYSSDTRDTRIWSNKPPFGKPANGFDVTFFGISDNTSEARILEFLPLF